MLRCTFDFDFSDVRKGIRAINAEVKNQCEIVGSEAVEYAVENGDYHDVSGNLRSSNSYRASAEGLELVNDAPYASDVETEHDVLGNAHLYAASRLKEIFEG